MDINQASLQMHYQLEGKIEVCSRVTLNTCEDLALAYTPGVAAACMAIAENKKEALKLTRKNHLVAVITDGTAVLGLGDIGPEAAMPVMEGKCALFKAFANVDAFPICIRSKDVDTIVNTIYNISKSFGGINLEDISSPRCFEIERRLKELCDIPIFHDDQHGTAIVVAAALINAVKVTGKKIGELNIVINGAGAAGLAISRLLSDMNFGNLIICDINGILNEEDKNLNEEQRRFAKSTNKNHIIGDLSDAMKGADVFIGVSKGNLVTKDMVRSMNKGIVFAMANPVPEIMPEAALSAGAAVVGTGRSDFPNQINNVLVFPGIFKGVLSCHAKEITTEMKKRAAMAIAGMIREEDLSPTNIIPTALDKSVADSVAKAVSKA